MRVLHICLAAFYIDNFGYQENILPKFHKKMGLDVKILASTENYTTNTKIGYVEPSSYINENGIPVTRIPYINYIPPVFARKFRVYEGVYNEVEAFAPDIIFLHDVQFISIKEIVKYLQQNAHVKVFADSHTDYINSGRDWLSMNVLHKIIYRWCAKKIEPYVAMFWGTLPARIDFYRDVYGIPSKKLDLLVMGADDSLFDLRKRAETKDKVRLKIGVKPNDFVIITGGKINKGKNIHLLMQAVEDIANKRVKLLVFGEPSPDVADIINRLTKSDKIISLGWIDSNKVYEYLIASDLACYPGTHSVLWEQTVGCGIPSVFKYWDGIGHVDVGGNCVFLEKSTSREIQEVIEKIVDGEDMFNNMKKVALNKGVEFFSYSKIAKKAIMFNDF